MFSLLLLPSLPLVFFLIKAKDSFLKSVFELSHFFQVTLEVLNGIKTELLHLHCPFANLDCKLLGATVSLYAYEQSRQLNATMPEGATLTRVY